MSQQHSFKAPQGLLRSLILAYASKYPVTGSEVAADVRSKTGGLWEPSPGSIYFLMNELKGKSLLILMKDVGTRRKAYIATEAGKAELAKTAKGLLGSLQREVSLLAYLASIVEPGSSSRMEALKWVMNAEPSQLVKLREGKT